MSEVHLYEPQDEPPLVQSVAALSSKMDPSADYSEGSTRGQRTGAMNGQGDFEGVDRLRFV